MLVVFVYPKILLYFGLLINKRACGFDVLIDSEGCKVNVLLLFAYIYIYINNGNHTIYIIFIYLFISNC
jgi:hypothetical protein